ncbi:MULTISPECIES: 50S ribosomal protein L21 [Halobacteriovorax]|uniref:Large ribosomal subunit protein bL21 n=1 Tax=Halobacteriovorax vibrionivorans TaxID=2152716 RepID=A0ABY0IJM9_9BACT|nr:MULTISPECIES: 50S ribosomal protein L21 [Halobacteriovorax]AYF45622.1 ribosomal protein L21 [Halobacteriovorax sp. BALOs_7]RZF22685.1 50S ribosomal protein L21 [Halobacteriovorax vibrionivorans]TGD46706.1 50S ribosomal protein L21 [Halobacteriovorax sp. Y22]
MYGVVEIQGHQYRVEAGMTIDVQKLDQEAGSTVEFDKVLFVGGESAKVGAPTVDGAKVVAEVVRHDRSRKVIVFKRKPGKYQKKNGHRQHFTTLKIKEVKA